METRRRGRRPGSKNYPKAFRELVIAQANDPGRSIAEVAQAHGLNASMVAQWRRQARICASVDTVLMPVDVVDAGADMPTAASPGDAGQAPSRACEIDIEVGGRRVCIRGVSPDLVERLVLGCLR
ncbi:hypothetical protein LMG19083_04932 [Ralstonia psammae]|uniref:Transposase n=1 Tax=Ralstonia psammae TaxID=3058598 RepID=A0ABN9JEK2_9RALS|nr:transposase [Ralstonia sp. LMG 19083]CAJ0809433.1 hypothetical protein LMG19083_04932 [Ralstonia sp. LMG 19083]